MRWRDLHVTALKRPPRQRAARRERSQPPPRALLCKVGGVQHREQPGGVLLSGLPRQAGASLASGCECRRRADRRRRHPTAGGHLLCSLLREGGALLTGGTAGQAGKPRPGHSLNHSRSSYRRGRKPSHGRRERFKRVQRRDFTLRAVTCRSDRPSVNFAQNGRRNDSER